MSWQEEIEELRRERKELFKLQLTIIAVTFALCVGAILAVTFFGR